MNIDRFPRNECNPENDEHSRQIVTHRQIELEKFEKIEVVSFQNFSQSIFFTILGLFHAVHNNPLKYIFFYSKNNPKLPKYRKVLCGFLGLSRKTSPATRAARVSRPCPGSVPIPSQFDPPSRAPNWYMSSFIFSNNCHSTNAIIQRTTSVPFPSS